MAFGLQNFLCRNYSCTQNDYIYEVENDKNAIRSPYIEIRLSDGSTEITVGNKSSPKNYNRAIVKSLSYGFSDGLSADLEIYDEEGGSFASFIDKIAKNPVEASEFYIANVKFGWIIKDVENNSSLYSTNSKTFFIQSVEMSYDVKGISFKLSLKDLIVATFSKKIKDSYSGDLQQAITKMFADVFGEKDTKGGIKVYFKKLDRQQASIEQMRLATPDSLQDVEWPEEVKKVQTWKTNNRDPLTIAKDWLMQFVTKKDKALTTFYYNDNGARKLIFLEDPEPPCDNITEEESCRASIGTYIVNGGKYSPVLSFNPTVKFNYSIGGQAGKVENSSDAKKEPTKGPPCPGKPKNSGTGVQTNISANEYAQNSYGVNSNINTMIIKAVNANEKVNTAFHQLEADLKIIGDPRYENPLLMKACTCTVIVMNPSHLRQNDEFSIPVWTVSGPCNQVFSSRRYRIKGISHEISGNNYTTTLKLFLPAALNTDDYQDKKG